MNEKKAYFLEINIMRGLAVICVVIGHSFDATDTPTVLGFLKSFVYCFHMPAFFFISGFLVMNKPINLAEKKTRIIKKAKRLMIPYFFLTVVTVGLKVVFGVFAKNPLNYSTLIADVLIGRNNPNGGLWFLYGLFVISAVGILLSGVDERIQFVGSIMLYFSNMWVFHLQGDCIAYFLSYAWFYFGGTMIRKYYVKIKTILNKIMTFPRAMVCICFFVFYPFVVFWKIYYVCPRVIDIVIPWGGDFPFVGNCATNK